MIAFLFVCAFSCFTASLSSCCWQTAPSMSSLCHLVISTHTASFSQLLKGTGGCTLNSHPHTLLNRILVYPEQNGCWTLKCSLKWALKCSPGAGKPCKPGWSVSQALFCRGYFCMYLFTSFTTQDTQWQQVISLSRLPLTLWEELPRMEALERWGSLSSSNLAGCSSAWKVILIQF